MKNNFLVHLGLAGVILSLLSGQALALATDCIEDGGRASCVPYLHSDFSFKDCRDSVHTAGNQRYWCEARLGNWVVNDAGASCVGASTVVTEANWEGLASTAEGNWFTACGTIAWTKSSWGTTVNSNYCATGGTEYKAGIIKRELQTAASAGSRPHPTCGDQYAVGYILERARDVYCPAGTLDTMSQGREVCRYPIAFDTKDDDDKRRDEQNEDKDEGEGGDSGDGKRKEVTCKPASSDKNAAAGGWASPNGGNVGNPVNVSAGVKHQNEVDYKSSFPGGLEFVRYYNSSGFFSLARNVANNEDYWTHSYSPHVIEIPSNAYAMAAVKGARGFVQYFDLTGKDFHNGATGSSKLERIPSSGTLTGWRHTLRSGDVRIYDAQGRLATITRLSGVVLTLAYGSGKLDSVTDSFGHTIALTYDGNGHLATMTDPSSRQTVYGYDAGGRLSTVTRSDLRARTYVYEDTKWTRALTGIFDERGTRLSTFAYAPADGRATATERWGPENRYTTQFSDTATTLTRTVTDAFGLNRTYTYAMVNGVPRMTSQTTGHGTRSAAYDANGNILTRTDARGNVTTYTYDAARNLETSRTMAYGTALARTVSTTWHSTLDLPLQLTRPSGVAGVNLVTNYTYDGSGNTTKYKLTAGALTREWNLTYNGFGQVLTIDGPRTDTADVTTLTYFAAADTCVGCRGRLSTITNPLGHVITYTNYNLDGRPLSVSDANGVVTTLAYNGRGWLTSATANGESTAQDYDVAGNLTKVTRPDGSWLHYSYDGANALIGLDDNLGNAIDYELDVKGNIVRTDIYDPQDQVKRTMQSVFDITNRRAQDFGALGQPTSYVWDNNSNLTSVTDPLGNLTTKSYDTLDRTAWVKNAYNNMTAFTYDSRDRVATVTDPRSLITTYSYNGLDGLTQLASPDSGTSNFTFDAAGNLVTNTDSRGVTATYSYDARGRVTAATLTDGTVAYEYDNLTTGGAYAKGHLTKVTDPSGNTSYVYDALGRITAKTQVVTASPSNKTFAVEYSFASGRQSGVTYPSGRAITYGFNSRGQVTSISVDGTSVLSSGEYFPFGAARKWVWGNGQVMERVFDQDGRVKTMTLGPSTANYGDLSQIFGYDNVNRLITANLAAGQTQSFAYDANSNRTSATINAALTTYTYPGGSHKLSVLSGATTRTFAYDNTGSTTSTAGISYTYDGRGRLKQAGTVTYLVNGLGQRVKKSAGSDVFFEYDEAGHLIGEYDSAGVAIQETLWLNHTPVAVIKPKLPSGFEVFYIWSDHLNSPRLISDTVNQSRWEWPHSDPFGSNVPNENPAGIGIFNYNLRFPGQYFDQETGLHYNSMRDYDPRIGRYIQSDPLGIRAGTNTYGYVSANPLSRSDSLGLVDIFVGGFADSMFFSRIVANYSQQSPGSQYFEHSQGQEIQDFINRQPANEPINIFGHSYGGDAAARAVARACRRINSLTTIDPVTDTGKGDRPDFGTVRDNVLNWTNVSAVPDRWNLSDAIAAAGGGGWGSDPRQFVDNFTSVNMHHGQFVGMMNFINNPSPNP
jgi:RHS repeat-associated protein